MLTRREALLGAAAAGVNALAVPLPSTPVNFDVPKGTTDCHRHVAHRVRPFPRSRGQARRQPEGPDYADIAPIAKALIAANPQRILWGTDWPHVGAGRGYSNKEVQPYLSIDDGRVLNQLAVWAPDPAVRKMILVDNPATLCRF